MQEKAAANRSKGQLLGTATGPLDGQFSIGTDCEHKLLVASTT